MLDSQALIEEKKRFFACLNKIFSGLIQHISHAFPMDEGSKHRNRPSYLGRPRLTSPRTAALISKDFCRSLAEEGVPEERIISIALDDLRNDALLDPRRSYGFVCGRVKGKRMHYLLVDDVQELPQFERVMNSLLHLPNLDVYVTGSNSRFLTSDVVRE